MTLQILLIIDGLELSYLDLCTLGITATADTWLLDF